MERRIRIEIFGSFEEENHSERKRRARMSPAECCRELAALQLRHWGKSWSSRPIVKTASWEKLPW